MLEETVVPKKYNHFIPSSASPAVKSYLEKTEDFVKDNQARSPFMLVKVNELTSVVNFKGKNFICEATKSGGSKETDDCKLNLITKNLLDNNVGKIPTSMLSEIQDAKTESPVNSYILLELKGDQSKWRSFENQNITIKVGSDKTMMVVFDKLLYKQTQTLDSQSVDVLVPLKKNIMSFLVPKSSAANLFQNDETIKKLKCTYHKQETISSTHTDDTCRLIKIRQPKDKDKTLVTLDAIKKASSSVTKADLSKSSIYKYLKLDIDINKFFNIGVYDFSNQNISVTNNGKTATFLISHSISDVEIRGKIKWLVVRYKGESGEIKTTSNYDVCSFENSVPGGLSPPYCSLHEINGEQPTSKESIEKISINPNKLIGTHQLIKDSFYAFQYIYPVSYGVSKINHAMYLYTHSGTNGGRKTYTQHHFEGTAILMDNPTKANKSLLLSEIGSLSS